MRLLKRESNGDIRLIDFSHGEVPPYAILSHTWGKPHEEVTLEDLKNQSGHTKIGHNKLQFCAEQARADRLEYFWADTCCIDRTNHAELSESINSMFRWYRDAEKCYVYLSDVSARKRDRDGDTTPVWEARFRSCRWFTRGWTLQELLAPVSVQFFSQERQYLGSRDTLTHLIHDITGIPIIALQGGPLSDFSVKERLRWAENRTTTRIEDTAYCLMGIFGVFIAPIYGEREHSFIRLKDEISKSQRCQLDALWPLPVGPKAIAPTATDEVVRHLEDAEDPEEKEMELLERRDGLLTSLRFDGMDARKATIKAAYSNTCAWLLESPAYMDWNARDMTEPHSGFLWVKGKPGAGKSTLIKFALAEAERASKTHEVLLSYFFNARGDTLDRSTVGMYRSLLFQLLRHAEDLLPLLDPITFSVHSPQWGIEILREVLTSAVRGLRHRTLTCFIDALDECNEAEIRDMIAHFEDLGRISEGRLHVFFTSRHYPTIIIRTGTQITLENETGHTEDLTTYIHEHLDVGRGKSQDGIHEQLHVKANGVFMWVVLVIPILNNEFRRGRIFAVRTRLNEIPAGLSDLFRDILHRDSTGMEDLLLCIQWILFAKRPLECKEFYYAMVAGLAPSSEPLEEWDPERVTLDDMSRFVTDCSKGLAELTHSARTPSFVQFTHESVRDFFLRDGGLQQFWPELGTKPIGLSHARLRESCRRYYTNVDCVGHDPSRPPLKERFPFIMYAAMQVLYHADKATKDLSEASPLPGFDCQRWLLTYNTVLGWDKHNHHSSVSLLYLFAVHDAPWLIRRHDQHIDLNGPSTPKERYQHPLLVAIAGRCWDAFRAILEKSGISRVPYIVESLQMKKQLEVGREVSPLHWALRHDCRPLVEALVASEAVDVNARYHHETALSRAASQGHDVAVRQLLARNAIDSESRPALFCAARRGHVQVVKLLLESDTYISQTGPHDAALAAASATGSLECVELLLDAGITITSGVSLSAALSHGHLQVSKLLIDRGAHIDMRSGSKLCAASSAGFKEIVEHLLDQGVDASARSSDKDTPLHAACDRGHYEVAKLLLERGAGVDDLGGYWGSALQAASAKGHLNIVRLLLERGADVNSRGGRFGSALELASDRRYEEIVRLLLERRVQM